MKRILIALIASIPLYASTFYVSNAGSDSNAGMQPKPFKTLAKATSAMKSGDTLLLDGSSKWVEQLNVTQDNTTFGGYNDKTKPDISGGTYGVNIGTHSHVTVNGLYVHDTANVGIFAQCSKLVQPSYDTIVNNVVQNTGWSGIQVTQCNYATMPPLPGWVITGNWVGQINQPKHLDYTLAGIQTGGLTGAIIQGNTVQTVNAMGIQDRPYYSAPCSANKIWKNTITNNEGNITGVCPSDDVQYNKITNSRGFGIQVGPKGNTNANILQHIRKSTDGTLFNGFDGKGAAGATYSNESVTDVDGCSITVEGAATGVTINGGTFDATAGGQCALYVTADSMPVKFTPNTVWNVAPTAKAFKLGGLANQFLLNKAAFLSKTK